MERKQTMIFSSRQMSRYHHLYNADTYSVVLNGNEAKNRIERKDSTKILGTKVDNIIRGKKIQPMLLSSHHMIRYDHLNY